MGETEITVQVLCSLEELTRLALQNGYEITDTYTLTDRYYSLLPHVKNVPFKDLVAHSFLLREIAEDGKVETNLVYKNKHFDETGTVVLREEKSKASVASAKSVAEVFEKAGLKPYAIVINHSTVFQKGEIEFSAQNIEGLGLFIEMEEFPFQEGKQSQEIIEELKNFLLDLEIPLGNNFACQKLWMIVNQNA